MRRSGRARLTIVQTDTTLPLSIALTMEEVLETADDADLRADVLESSVGHIPTSPGIARKADRLHEVAHDLRDIAEHIGDGLTEPRGPS